MVYFLGASDSLFSYIFPTPNRSIHAPGGCVAQIKNMVMTEKKNVAGDVPKNSSNR